MRIAKWLLMLMALALTASAADVAGTWTGNMETPNGTFEMTFSFKVDGHQLTGTVTLPMGESPISHGKVEGDDISFSVVRNGEGNELKINYKGKVAEKEMKLTVEIPARGTFKITAKKVS